MRAEVLTGARQEVGRGELAAFLMALRSTCHNVIYVCDRRSVYDGWHSQAWKAKHLEDSDLWREVPHAAAGQSRAVLVLWTESHQDDGALAQAQQYYAFGNGAADRAAKERRRVGAVATNADEGGSVLTSSQGYHYYGWRGCWWQEGSATNGGSLA